MIHLYTIILYQPLYNLLIFFYNIIPGHDIGLAIIALTIIIKLILFPLSAKSIKSQKSLQDLQPKVDEIKKKYKDDKEKLAKETMNLYKENNVNPFSSCLPLIVQFPFLIAVYNVFRTGLSGNHVELLYPFISRPEFLNPVSFGIFDLSKSSIYLALLAGAAQFVQARMLSTKKVKPPVEGAKDENLLAEMNKNMLYLMPVMTVFIAMRLPSGLALYWFITTILTVLQQFIIFRKKPAANGIIPASNK